MNNLPGFIEKYIKKLSDETKVHAHKIRTEYEKIFADPFIQQDEQFTTEKQRHIFAIKVLIARNRPVKLSTKDTEEAEI